MVWTPRHGVDSRRAEVPRENLVAVRRMHELIDRIRADYGDPDLPVDIIAHSNGGLIASYYLRYGPNDVLS